MPRQRGPHAHDDAHPSGHGPGRLVRWPRRYDLLVAVAMAGRGARVRDALADLLQVQPQQRVLDVGCGSGTLALSLLDRVAPGGTVTGVDPSVEALAVARAKAARRRVRLDLHVASAQALPFEDASFDAAVTSLVLHHLPPPARPLAVAELVRVVRPGGRLVLADFRPPALPLGRRLVRHLLGHAMAENDIADLLELAAAAGLEELRLARTPIRWLGAVAGRTPSTHPSG